MIQSNWERFSALRCDVPAIGLSLDISRTNVTEQHAAKLAQPFEQAFDAMEALERGAIANPDENRMVGHYWLRNPRLAPTQELRVEIESTLAAIKRFASDIHGGQITAPNGERFTDVLSIGIGGSALGPMFVSDALGDEQRDRLRVHFIDNTDPEGIERVLQRLRDRLKTTLTLVISKSGGTPETRNGMLLAQAAYEAAGLPFGPYAVAITGIGSQLDDVAQRNGWLARFPMWDWVGGRTSELSAVGLLPALLQGIDVDAMLAGAAACDEATRVRDVRANPAALLALAWYVAGSGKGAKDMVILPYKDRLLLFSRYLQQLVMESLGKKHNLAGQVVEQGIAVYGNKGSTDQHAYVQQLRDGVNNFFAVFVRVLESGGKNPEVEPGVTSGDYLHGFLLGTRAALHEGGRESITITVTRVDARSVGALIALFERAVGLYAALIGINAYHQPGVEAGKRAAAQALDLQRLIEQKLHEGATGNAAEIAAKIGQAQDAESVYLTLEHLAANGRARMNGTGVSATFSK